MAERRRAAVVLLLVALLTGCTAGGEGADPTPSPSMSPADEAAPSSSPETAAPEPASPGPADPADDDAPALAGQEDRPTAEPVPMAAAADFGTGVTAELVAVDAVQAEARGPGEVTGPALAFEISLTNDSAGAVDLRAVTVNLVDEEGAPGLPMLGPPAAAFDGSLEPGASTTGTYVFAVPEGSRSTVSLEVSYSTQAPVVVFRGSPDDV